MAGQERIKCWSIEEAEQGINTYARNSSGLELAYSEHAEQRLAEREIIISDILYVLAHGYITEEPEETTRPGYCKYKICSKSPNSGNREICVIVIPEPQRPAVKIITVMWKDL